MAGRKHSALLVITAAVLCFAVLGSFLFITAGAGHNCTHDDDCAVCRMIDAYICSLRCVLAVTAVFVCGVAAAAFTAALFRAGTSLRPVTLISLKTELRN